MIVLTKASVGDAGSTGVYTAGHLIQLIVYELPVGAALFAFLHLRGWSLERLGVRFSAIETLVGFGLAFFAELACYLPLLAVALAFPASIQAMTASQPTPGGFGLATVVALSIVNPIFEETFVCGYVITVLKERSDASTAVTISTAIRLLYHLYQGPLAFFGIVPFGLVVGGGTRGAAGCGPSSSRTASAISSRWSATRADARGHPRSAASWRTRSRIAWCAAIRLWLSGGSSAARRSCGGLSCAEM